MAIEIKRTPVLEGNAAEAFTKAISEKPTKVSEDTIRHAMTEATKILQEFKAKANSNKK